jgi:integrase
LFVARKNGNGEGSRPRRRPDGRWEARYWAETPTGRKRSSVYGKTRKEVVEKLTEAMTTRDEEHGRVKTNITLRDFLAQYEEVAKDTMKRRSFETYRDIARLHLLPALGTTKLKDLSREHVQRMYSRKRDQGLSAARVKRIHGVLSAALNKAVLWHLISHNVCKEVSPPRVEAPEIKPLTREQARRFLAASECDRYYALYALGLTTGMRLGELGGLFYSDLDLDRGKVRVNRALITGYGGQTLESPKTPTSRRTITLTTKAVEALRYHWDCQEKAGLPVEGDALVFTNMIGGFINPSHFTTRSFKPLLKRAGLPHTNFHAATRHTCCCLLLEAGVNPKAVSLQLGHSSVAFTLQRYAHYMPGMGDAAAGAMDEALE